MSLSTYRGDEGAGVVLAREADAQGLGAQVRHHRPENVAAVVHLARLSN